MIFTFTQLDMYYVWWRYPLHTPCTIHIPTKKHLDVFDNVLSVYFGWDLSYHSHSTTESFCGVDKAVSKLFVRPITKHNIYRAYSSEIDAARSGRLNVFGVFSCMQNFIWNYAEPNTSTKVRVFVAHTVTTDSLNLNLLHLHRLYMDDKSSDQPCISTQRSTVSPKTVELNASRDSED